MRSPATREGYLYPTDLPPPPHAPVTLSQAHDMKPQNSRGRKSAYATMPPMMASGTITAAAMTPGSGPLVGGAPAAAGTGEAERDGVRVCDAVVGALAGAL